MAQTYQASAKIRCLKEHLCKGCGGRFAYLLERDVVGQGSDEAAADRVLEHNTLVVLQEAVDRRPCPHCGVLQPEMIADVVSPRFQWGFWVAAIGLAVALVAGLAEGVPVNVAAWLGVASCIAGWAIDLWGASYRPNLGAGPSVGVQTAQADAAAGKLLVGPPNPEYGGETPDLPDPTRGRIQTALALGLVAAAVCAAPNFLASLAGWNYHPDCFPPVVGPGDAVKIRFGQGDQITSVNGMWQGLRTECRVENAGALGAPNTLSAETKESTWGETIRGKNISNSTERMWVKTTLPSDAALVGKKLDLALAAEVKYPFKIGNTFDIRNGSFSHKTSLELGNPGAGGLYFTLWWGGQLVAVALVFVAWRLAAIACKKLRADRSETRVMAPGAPPGADDAAAAPPQE